MCGLAALTAMYVISMIGPWAGIFFLILAATLYLSKHTISHSLTLCRSLSLTHTESAKIKSYGNNHINNILLVCDQYHRKQMQHLGMDTVISAYAISQCFPTTMCCEK